MKSLTLAMAFVLIGQPVFAAAVDIPSMPKPDQQQQLGQPATLPPNYFKAMEGRVVKSLVTMSQIQKDADRLDKTMTDLSKFLQDSMINVSYPVLLPAVSTNPITLATPNFQMYSGHFPEARTKYVVSSVANIASLIAVLEEDMDSIEIPPDKSDALTPLVTDAQTVMGSLKSDFAILYGQVAGGGTAIDGEVMAGKLLDMKKYVATIENDIAAIFRITNLKNASPQLVKSVVDLKLFGRDAHWLGIIAEYLRDGSKQLSPLTAFVNDAEDQGWMVLGPSLKQYSQIERSPYMKQQVDVLNKRMTELSQYIQAVQSDLQTLNSPADQVPQIKGELDQLSSIVSDVNSRYQKLQATISTPPVKDLGTAVFNQAQAICDDMKQADKIEHQIADKLLGDSSVF